METKNKSQSPIKWVLGQTGDHGGQYILSVILAVFGVAFSIAPYFAVIGIVQGLMSGVTDFPFYLNRCLLMAAFWLGRVLFHALSTATSHRATFAVLGEIRKRCMEKLTRMPLGAVLEQSSGALKNTLIERIDSIETTLAHIVPEFTANLLIPAVIIIYIFTIDWMRASIIPFTFAMVIMPATMVSVLPIGGLLVRNGSLSAEDYVTVIILSVGVITPIITLMSYSDDMRTMGTIFGEVRSILDAPEMIRPAEGMAPDGNDLEFKDVHFAYKDAEVLHGVSLRMNI